MPIDYQFNQYEQTEQLLYVEDNEVNIKPPGTLTSKHILIEPNYTKEEHNKQLSASNEFKQRALMDMMDGVLEKRWEDELKKDVPKPLCMVVQSYFKIYYHVSHIKI